MDDLIDLNEAERLTGIPAPSLRKRLNSTGPDRIPGVRVPLGRREVWRLTRATVEALQNPERPQADETVSTWASALASGYLTGKPVGHHTINSYRYGLEKFWRLLARGRAVELVTADNVREVLTSIPVDYEAKNCHYAQRREIYDAVVSFARHLVMVGKMAPPDRTAILALRPKRVFPPRRTSLKPEALDQLLDAIKLKPGRPEYDKDLLKTAVLLMTLAGLRRAEALDLEVGHLDLDRAELLVIDGKGHKDRLVGMPPDLVEQLRYWLTQRKPSRWPQVLLMRDGRPMTSSALQQRIDRLRKAAGLDITLHGLRRTCATLMVDSGVPLVHVQRNLGHRQISTTMAYVQTDQQTAAESFKRFSLGLNCTQTSYSSPAPPPVDGPVKPDAVLGFVKAKRGKK